MRKYLISLLISILFMILGSSMWMSREFMISLSSQLEEGTEVTLIYKTPRGSFSQTKKIQKTGEANYIIPGKIINELKFALKTDNVQAVKEVNVRSDKKQKIYLFEVAKKILVGGARRSGNLYWMKTCRIKKSLFQKGILISIIL